MELFDLEINAYVINSLFYIPIAFIFLGIFYFLNRVSSLMITGVGVLLMSVYLFLIYYGLEVERMAAFPITIIGFIIVTIAELCITAITLSYATRLASVRFGSTLIGAYLAMTFLGNKILQFIFGFMGAPNLLVLAITQ